MEAILAIISGLFASTTIIQLFTIKSQKEKIKANVKQEQAISNGLELKNMKELLSIQGEQLVGVELRNKNLVEENYSLQKKLREYDYKLGEVERKVSGMERVITEEISRRDFAETNICLNTDCKERKPKLGEFKYNYKH